MSDDAAPRPDEVKRPWEVAADKRRKQGSRLGLPDAMNGPWWTPLLYATLGGAWMAYRVMQEHTDRSRVLFGAGLVVYILLMLWAAVTRRRRR